MRLTGRKNNLNSYEPKIVHCREKTGVLLKNEALRGTTPPILKKKKICGIFVIFISIIYNIDEHASVVQASESKESVEVALLIFPEWNWGLERRLDL